MIRRSLPVVVLLALTSGFASAQQRTLDAGLSNMMLFGGIVQSCIESDALLRKTCARIGATMPEKDRQHCALPGESFQARTERGFQAYKQTYHAEWQAIAPELERMMREARERGKARYADLIAGTRISMLDVYELSDEVQKRCKRPEEILRQFPLKQPR